MNKKIGFSLFAVIFLFATISMASAVDISSCQSIDSSGSYDIINDLTGTGSEACLIVNAQDVYINGNGYLIDGVGFESVVVTSSATSNFNLQNVYLKSYGSVEALTMDCSVTGNTLQDVNVYTDLNLNWGSACYTQFNNLGLRSTDVVVVFTPFSVTTEGNLYFTNYYPTHAEVTDGSAMDVPATIYFYNLASNSWILLRNGDFCNYPDCEILFQSDIQFEVTIQDWGVFDLVPDTFPPNIYLTSPLNTTYNYNVSVLNFTCDGSEVWYSTDGGLNNYSAFGLLPMATTSDCATTSFENVPSVEGSNTWTIYSKDGSGNENSTSVTFFKDTIPPSVSLLFPLNLTYQFNVSQINYTCTNGAFAWYSRNGGVTNSSPVSCGNNFTNVQSIDGGNTWLLYANDTLGNLVTTQVTFTKSIPLEIGYVNVTLLYPTNQLNSTIKTLSFDANIIPTNVNLTNATLFIWHTNSTLYQSDFTSLSGNVSTLAQFTRTLELGNYYFNVLGCGYHKANSSDIECNFANNNFTLYVTNLVTESVIINNTQATYEDVIFDVTADNIAIYFNTPNETINITFINWTILANESKIIFPEVNFNFFVNESLNTLNFNTTIFVEYNNITIISDEFTQLNTTAHLIFYNLPFDNPVIMRNGVECPVNICTNFVYANGTAEFDVTGFSSYTLEEEQILITNGEGNLIQGSGTFYSIMKSGGAGLGKFMEYMTIALPLFLIGIMIVGVIVVIAMSIGKFIKSGVKLR